MANALLDALADRVLVADGAMGTMLQRAGLEPGGCGELFNLQRPDVVRGIHQAYVDAGADLLLTNTFNGTRFRLGHYGLQGEVAAINRRAAQIAREAAGPDRFVMGDVGPTGRYMEPYGDETPESLSAAFREQMEALAEGGCDGIHIETMLGLAETEVAVAAARATGLPCFVTLFFQRAFDGAQFHSMAGESPSDVVTRLFECGASAVGANCGVGLDQMIPILAAMRRVSAGPLIAKANAGLPELVAGEAVYRQSPAEFRRMLPELLESRPAVIGGCCGTTPEHIRVLAEAVGRRAAP